MTRPHDDRHWRRLDALFAAALERPDPERMPFLRQHCGGDEELFTDARDLLERASEAERVLGESVVDVAGAVLQELFDHPTRDDPSPGPGDRVGPYVILEEIGRGGMGIVYRARDLRLDRLVALKFLPPHLSADGAARRRFIDEARAASATDHPNVATLHEIGETGDGRAYLVLAHYDGETLKERISRGPVPTDEAIRIAVQVAAGLAAAHSKGVVHRDIKPGNVMVAADGWARILDFGIAKVAGDRDRDDRAGTVAYMSPEQIRGEGVDGRTDIWSLGVVLFEMLTGALPFRGDGKVDLAESILNDPPAGIDPPDPRIPAELAPVLARALAREPAGRFRSADELLRQLEQCRQRPAAPAPDGSSRRRLARRRVAAGVVLAMLVLAGAWRALRDTGAPLPEPAAAAVSTADAEQGSAPALLQQGTEYLRRYRREDNELAITILRRAAEADPGSALAHARLAVAFALKVFQYGDPELWADSALVVADLALALDPDLAEAHHAVGLAHLSREHYDEALAAATAAAELDPGYWAAPNVAGVVNWRVGRQDDALRWYMRALPLDPAGRAPTLSTIAGSYAFLGLFDEARAAVDRALELQPDLPLAYLNAVLLALVRGDDTEAVDHARTLVTTSPGNARAWATAGSVHQFAGDHAAARARLERAYEISPSSFDLMRRDVRVLLARTLLAQGEPDRAATLLAEFDAFAREQLAAGNPGPFVRYSVAASHAIRHRTDEAVRWLEEAVAAGWTDHLLLAGDPLFENLREDARFEGILARNRAEMARQRVRVPARARDE